MASKPNLLVVMAKAPEIGKVKTRLIPPVGKHRATCIYRSLLLQTIESVAGSSQYDVVLSCSPDTGHPDFQRHRLKFPIGLQRQPSGGLGIRMSRLFSCQLKRYQHVILIGSDIIGLSIAYMEYAFKHLQQGSDLVLGITDDGGYALIGMNKPRSALFRNIRWSTASVSRITLQRARRMKLATAELKNLNDIDTYADYTRYIAVNRKKSGIKGKTGFDIWRL